MSRDGAYPAEIALFLGQQKLLRALLAAKADAGYRRKADGNSLLMMAAHEGHFDILRDLYHAGAHTSPRNRDGHTMEDILYSHHQKRLCDVGLPDVEALMVAAENDDTALMSKCISCKTPLNNRNRDEVTALGVACYFNSVACVKLLAGSKADPNIAGQNDATPLHLAVHQAHDHVVAALTEGYSESELDQAALLGRSTSALHTACQEGLDKIVHLLLNHSIAARDLPNADGIVPLYAASHEGHIRCVNELLSHKANPNCSNERGTTALFIATQKSHEAVCAALLRAKADPSIPNAEGSSPLRTAVFHCNAPITRLLLDHGANVDDTGASDGSTVAMMAAKSLDLDILLMLLAKGASLSSRNQSGSSVDDIMRLLHGISLADVAYYWLAKHQRLNPFGPDEGKDLATIHGLFSQIDTDKNNRITKAELNDALQKWGLTSKYGQQFAVFVDTEFDRLDHDVDGAVSFAEFRACYARFHMLYRSTSARTTEREQNLTIDAFDSGVPLWMRKKSISAAKAIWNAHRQRAELARVSLPPNWVHQIVFSLEESRATLSSNPLISKFGFDVEEIVGPVDHSGVPGDRKTYLRVTYSSNARTLAVGDIIMAFFGDSATDVLRRREIFVATVKDLPLILLTIHRGTDNLPAHTQTVHIQDNDDQSGATASDADDAQSETSEKANPTTIATSEQRLEMQRAIISGNAAAVRSLLLAKADQNMLIPATSKTDAGSPLTLAMQCGHANIMKLFIDKTNVNVQDSQSGATALYAAVQMQSDIAVQTLLQLKVRLRQQLRNTAAA